MILVTFTLKSSILFHHSSFLGSTYIFEHNSRICFAPTSGWHSSLLYFFLIYLLIYIFISSIWCDTIDPELVSPKSQLFSLAQSIHVAFLIYLYSKINIYFTMPYTFMLCFSNYLVLIFFTFIILVGCIQNILISIRSFLDAAELIFIDLFLQPNLNHFGVFRGSKLRSYLNKCI